MLMPILPIPPPAPMYPIIYPEGQISGSGERREQRRDVRDQRGQTRRPQRPPPRRDTLTYPQAAQRTATGASLQRTAIMSEDRVSTHQGD